MGCDGLGEITMLRSTTEAHCLLLTADLMQRDGRFPRSARNSGDTAIGLLLQRFPPIEDVVVSLDNIASRTIAA
jgi:hypothetical protein